MTNQLNNLKLFVMLTLLMATLSLSAGHYKGRLLETTTNDVQPKVTVMLKELSLKMITDQNGEFVFRRLEAGTYTLQFKGISIAEKEVKIKVENNDDVDNVHVIPITFRDVRANEVDVYSSNRRLQKITEAPSAISVVSGKALEQATSHGQLSKTLEHIQGIDVVQSGMNDFNINTRGFNNSINRRVLVLVDGRDPSTPLLNLMEWNSLQTNLADISKIEVVRGPGSALYGMNAYNGVINITTNAPKDVLGTRVSVTGGDYNTLRADARHAGKITDDLLFKVNVGGSSQRQSWIGSRDLSGGGSLEYTGLLQDVKGNRPGVGNIQNIDSMINQHKTAQSIFGTARLDYTLNENATILAEIGYSRYKNEYFVNQTGRILIPDVEKPFARVAYNSKNWNIQAHWSKRNTPMPQVVMNAAATSGEKSDIATVDAQWNESYLQDQLKVVAGVSHEYQHIITAAAGSSPLLNPDNLHNNFTGVYGQFEYSILKNLQLVGATRFDRSTLFANQFSPKAALVWAPIDDQTFRFTVNRSFLRPSYSDYQRRSPAGPPANYSAIDNAIAQLYGIDTLGLRSLSQWNLGNKNIGVESSVSYEIGYKGVITDEFYITADVYYNRRSNFISNPLGGLVPQLYTPVRYKNADGTENVEANKALQDSLTKVVTNPLLNPYDRLSIDPVTGKASLIVAPKNIGMVDEYGVEIGVNYYLNSNLFFTANYTHLGFEVTENTVATNKILPNSSPNKVNFGIEYDEKKGSLPFNVNLNVRGVQGFKWIAGFFEGNVPEYWVVNLSAGVSLTKEMKLGVNVFNLLDRRHYQIFGGTYLQRVATASLAYTF